MKNSLKYNNISVTLPRDVIKKRNTRVGLKIASFILGEGAALFIAYLFSTNSTEIATMFTYLIAVAIPVFITGVPHKLIDKTTLGEVVKVGVNTAPTAAMKDGPKSMHHQTTVTLYIKDQKGGISVHKIGNMDTKRSFGYKDFKQGDIVFHLYGTKHYILLPLNDGMDCKCVLCGTTVSGDNTRCGSCGHTLVKSDYKRGY